ncbi:MAG: hypothetical protein Q6354_08990 [Candidatus Brocadiales bacterium]|nr:hypothetical protein [Candidatus Brocadiales bacterium]
MFTVFLCFVSTPALFASEGWAATYGDSGNDRASCIQQTRNGGYIVAGTTNSFGAGNSDFWVLKLRPDGTVEWQKTYGGNKYDQANSIQQIRDGGYIVAGLTCSFGTGRDDIWVLKLKSDGTVEWQKTYGGDSWEEAHSIQQTSDGGYIVAGETSSFSSEGDRVANSCVLKLRSDGTVEWYKTYGGNECDEANCVQQTRDGGYIVAGRTHSFRGFDSDFWVLKLRSDGTIEWQKTYGGNSNDWANSIHETSDGGYVVAGLTGSFAKGGAWVLKLRADGTIQWQRTYGEGLDAATSIQQTSDGGYIMAGFTTSSGDKKDRDLLILKLRPNGTVEWYKTCGGDLGDWAESIHETRDGGYVVVGETESFGAGNLDLWVLKFKPDGSIDGSYNFIRDTRIWVGLSIATARSTRVNPRNSNVNLRESQVTVLDTSISAKFLTK